MRAGREELGLRVCPRYSEIDPVVQAVAGEVGMDVRAELLLTTATDRPESWQAATTL